MEMSNERFVSPNTALKIVKHSIRLKRPVMLHGPPGVGKSDMIRQVGMDLGRDVYDVRLLLMTEVDIRGIPYFSATTGNMEWAPPSAFPLNKDSNAIIFLDEITQASPSVQAAALQLVLDRKIGEFELGDEVALVAAGNRASDRTGAKALIKALANRFMHLNIKVNFKDWQAWALNHGVHPDIIGFLSHKNEHLDTFNPSSPENSFATPRTWSYFVSQYLYDPEIANDKEILNEMIIGSVGQSIALEFMNVRELLTKLPHPDDILAGKVKSLEINSVAAQFSLMTSVSYRLKTLQSEVKAGRHDQADWYKAADNFLEFATDLLSPEIIVTAISLGITSYKLPYNHTKMPNYKKFFTKYEHLFQGMYAIN
jgi:hypothetical protein